MTSLKRAELIVIAGLLAAPALFSATFVVPPDRAMVARADAIVVATAQTSSTRISALGGIETVTPLQVEEVIKGDLLGDAAVHEPGGTIGSRTTFIAGVPRFAAGERVILFLSRTPQHTWAVTDLVLGKFRLEMGRTGRTLAIRDAGEIVGWDSDGSVHHEPRRVAADFLDFIRATVRGEQPNINYVLPPRLSSGTESTQNLSVAPLATFTGLSYTSDLGNGLGGRWTVFPSAVTFFTGSVTEPGAPGGGVTAVQTGIASWDNDCGSNVNYVYGGTDSVHSSGLSAPDGANTVLFERNLSAYGVGPFSCSANGYSGTLGIGGITNASGTHVLNGQTYYTTQEGDVEMNQGIANCTLLFNNGDFNSAVTHELGHTLGFRHSDQTRADNPSIACTSDPTLECSNTAIMKSFIPTGLNAQLQPWDVDAVRGVYPSTCIVNSNTHVKYDLNADTKADIFLRNFSTGDNSVWLMNGTTKISGAYSDNASLNWVAVGMGDFDGNGTSDVFWRDPSTGANAVWLMNGAVKTGAYLESAATSWSVGAIADLNGDGKADVFWTNTNGSTAVWLMNGASKSVGAVLENVPAGWQVVGSGDFDGDGNADILWRNTTTGANSIWFMNGTTKVSGAYTETVSDLNWKVVGVGDFDGDGKADILWRNTATGADAIWFMNGATKTLGSYIETSPTNWSVAEVGDFNGDGRADILWRDNSTGADAMWLMNGATKTVGAYLETAPTQWHVVK